MGLRIAVTADLHWGLSPEGDRSTRSLVGFLERDPPDALVLAGDTGVGEALEKGLKVFRHLSCVKLLTAGNHDLWAMEEGMDSLEVYSHDLARAASLADFKYLDDGPWIAPDRSVAVAGSVNWYDYTLAPDSLLKKYPNSREIFRRKLFTKARHNDGRFIKFGMTDDEFTGLLVRRVKEHLEEVSGKAESIVLATHHPPLPELFKPLPVKPDDDEFLWYAYSGNARMRDLVLATPKIRAVVCGHTHVFRRETVGSIEGVNVGSDYGEKRVVMIHTPEFRIEVKRFPVAQSRKPGEVPESLPE